MTNKYKVSDLAKDLNMSSKEVSAIATEVSGVEKKSSATLNEVEIGRFFNKLTNDNAVKNFTTYFATGAEAREKAKKAREEEKNKKLLEQMAILEQLKAAAAAEDAKNKPTPKKVEEKKVETPKAVENMKKEVPEYTNLRPDEQALLLQKHGYLSIYPQRIDITGIDKLQLLKAHPPISVTPFGIDTLVNDVHFSNAPSSIVNTLLEISMLSKDVQLENIYLFNISLLICCLIMF